jgi:hypothetical protein
MKAIFSILAFLFISASSFGQTKTDKQGNPVCCAKSDKKCCSQATSSKTTARKAAPIKYQIIPKEKHIAIPPKKD